MRPEDRLPPGPATGRRRLMVNDDGALLKQVDRVLGERAEAGLDGLVGDLQCIVVNTEPGLLQDAAREFLQFTGHDLVSAAESTDLQHCLLRRPGSADVLLTARMSDTSLFPSCQTPRCMHLPHARLETFIFATPDLARYVEIQKRRKVTFMTADTIETDTYRYIQTTPSVLTGNAVGLIEWKSGTRSYGRPGDRPLAWDLAKPNTGYQRHIRQLDHAATRVRAEDRDPAILEFMALTNYTFSFAIHVPKLNSITNVARLPDATFAMVFTSGEHPYIGDDESGPTERFVHYYGPRVHHLAFHTEEIEETFAGLKRDGMDFLVDLVGSPQEGLRQTFSQMSPTTLLVNEYIHRYGDFDGFFTQDNVAALTEATGRQ